MSITKESLGTKEPWPYGYQSYGDGSYLDLWESRFKEEGKRIIDQSKVRYLLQELADVIKPEFSDVAIDLQEKVTFTHGNVSFGMSWNHQVEDFVGFKRHTYNLITVMARAATSELVIGAENGGIVLKAGDWIDQEVVERAIINAYHNPYVQRVS